MTTFKNGFGISDCSFLGISHNVGYELFVQGWKHITKEKLILYENSQVYIMVYMIHT